MSICNTPFILPELNMIGGDYKEVYISVDDLDRGMSMDITHLVLNFSLNEYSKRHDNTPILKKNCEIAKDDPKCFLLILEPDDTKHLLGKFIYQFTVKAPNNKQQSFQGVLHIDKNINPDAFTVV